MSLTTDKSKPCPPASVPPSAADGAESTESAESTRPSPGAAVTTFLKAPSSPNPSAAFLPPPPPGATFGSVSAENSMWSRPKFAAKYLDLASTARTFSCSSSIAKFSGAHPGFNERSVCGSAGTTNTVASHGRLTRHGCVFSDL